MGRPINKNILTNIVVDVLAGATPLTKTIAKQVGSKRFHLEGQGTTVFTLVTKPVEDLAANEMSIRAFAADESTLLVAKITQRKLTAGDGTVHAWSFAAASGSVVQANNSGI
jgi:hypothetical protein